MRHDRAEQETDDAMPARRLSVCQRCRRGFVVPLGWDEYSETSWRITLRCGACGTSFELIASDEDVAAFCHELDHVLDALELDATRLERERAEAEIAVVATALAKDLISGDDFAARSGSRENQPRRTSSDSGQ